MHTPKVAEKLRAQIHQFSGIISPHFSKPKTKFIEQMLLGIAASQDCKLSRIARALAEPVTLKKTEERLSRHLAAPQLGQQVQAQIVAQAARRIGQRRLVRRGTSLRAGQPESHSAPATPLVGQRAGFCQREHATAAHD